MPLVYSEAPLPAAAVLSGAAVKSGVIGLIVFLPFGTALPAWGHALACVGFASAIYGVVVGLTQINPRRARLFERQPDGPRRGPRRPRAAGGGDGVANVWRSMQRITSW